MTASGFAVTGPLPRAGTHILEASAGTGKTYAIAALAARYLADGLPLGELMMVTFSRAATQELRDRIRSRLNSTEAALARVLAGGDPGPDEVDRLICTGTPEQLARRLQLVRAALADFDSATIATTHEFCSRMLDGLGVLGGHTDDILVEDVGDLVREVAADFWLRAYADADRPEFTWDEAVRIAHEVAEFDGPLAPKDLSKYSRHLAFAEAVRAEVARRKRARGLVTFDDLLTRLRDLLNGLATPDAEHSPELEEAVRTRLRRRFRVVLVDEFQDTDPVQWEILDTAFTGHSTMLLIGDPKQAIYAFRGAEVHAYLAAVASPGAEHHTLDTNWRSDGPLVEALDGLMRGACLGHPRIEVRRVQAHHRATRLSIPDPDLRGPIRLRALAPPQPAPGSGRVSSPSRWQIAQLIVEDLVADIGRLLGSGAEVHVEAPRPLSARDIAVLVRSNAMAERIRAALTAAGIPAIHTGATSVFETREARDWLLLLSACESPRGDAIRQVALSGFVGWSFVDLVRADETQLAELSGRVRAWARILSKQGVAGLTEALLESGLAERLLARPGGDRQLTDLRHLGELLHTTQHRDSLGTTALIEWLTERVADHTKAPAERTRRMESDSDAVQVMTVHRAKGLEFPVVYLPDQWTPHLTAREKEPFHFHVDGRRHLYLAPAGDDRIRLLRLRDEEEAGQALRLLYVALTRSQCQVVAWWAGVDRTTPGSPLHRLLFRAGATEPALHYSCSVSPADVLLPPGVIVQPVGQLHQPSPATPAEPVPELRARVFTRTLDPDWRRTSYSALTARAHDLTELTAAIGERGTDEIPVVPDDIAVVSDEVPQDSPPPPAPLTGALAMESPMASLPRGPAFGTLVHAIYETFDPHVADLAEEVRQHASRWLARLPVGTDESLSVDGLADALLPAMRTPLGPIAGELRLCDLPATDRLAELDFEYALVGGDRPVRRLLLGEIAELLRRHLPADDPLRDYAERLADPVLAGEVLRGFLVGSIDAVLRVPAPDGGRRYLVVDYKTNWLGPLESETPLMLGHYTPAAMAAAMMDAHYPLQALLYAVALHRYLRWRLPGYRPERDLGGVAYLFVRGMAGLDTPRVDGRPCGVFDWQPPAALVTELSDLLAGKELS